MGWLDDSVDVLLLGVTIAALLLAVADLVWLFLGGPPEVGFAAVLSAGSSGLAFVSYRRRYL